MDFTEGAVRRKRDLSEGFMCVFASLGQYDEKTGTLPREVCK